MATRNDTNEPTNTAAEAGRNATDEAARTVQTVTKETAKVGESTAHAGADVARQSTEAAHEVLQVGLNTAAQNFQRFTDQLTQVLGFAGPQAEELARRSSENLQAVTQASTILVKGAQDVSREWFGLAQERLTRSIDDLNRLTRSRSLHDFVAVQSDLVRDNLQQVIDTNRRVAELAARVAEDAARSIQAQGNRLRRAA
jgi:phasin family protein